MDPSTAVFLEFCMVVTVSSSPVCGWILYWHTMAQFGI